MFLSVPLFLGFWVELTICGLFLTKIERAMDNTSFKALI